MSSVHHNYKFNYLKSVFDGKANYAIEGINLTSENYEHAICILKERFGDPQVIITASMDGLSDLKSIYSSQEIAFLHKFYDSTEIHSRNLTSFDINMVHYSPILISVIMSTLPEDCNLNISQQMPPGKWILKSLLDVFKHELISVERVSGSYNSNLCRCESHNSSDQSPTSGAVLTMVEGRNGKSMITYTFCKMNHPSNLCHIEKKYLLVKKF